MTFLDIFERKLTDDDARGILDGYYNGKESISSLAQCYRVSETTILNIIDRKGRWSHLGIPKP